jgi:hypothetical protein
MIRLVRCGACSPFWLVEGRECPDKLPQTAATSIEGILAKLLVILHDGEHWDRPDDFPWPHIRSVLDDLARHHRYRSGDDRRIDRATFS